MEHWSEADERVVRDQEEVGCDRNDGRQQSSNHPQQEVVDVDERPRHVEEVAEDGERAIRQDQVALERPHRVYPDPNLVHS